jgi:hypothetical protein
MKRGEAGLPKAAPLAECAVDMRDGKAFGRCCKSNPSAGTCQTFEALCGGDCEAVGYDEEECQEALSTHGDVCAAACPEAGWSCAEPPCRLAEETEDGWKEYGKCCKGKEGDSNCDSWQTACEERNYKDDDEESVKEADKICKAMCKAAGWSCGGLAGWAIALIVIAVLLVVGGVVAGVLVYFFVVKKKKGQDDTTAGSAPSVA